MVAFGCPRLGIWNPNSYEQKGDAVQKKKKGKKKKKKIDEIDVDVNAFVL